MNAGSMEDRLRTLERRMRTYRTLSVLACGVGVIVVLSAQARPTDNAAKELRAQRFVLVDKNNAELAELGVAREDGSVRLVVRKGAGAWIGVRGDGTPAVALLRPDGRGSVELKGGAGARGLSVFGDDDVDYIRLLSSPETTALKLTDANHHERVFLGSETDGPWTTFHMSDAKGERRTSVFVDEASSAGVLVRDGKGKELWKAP